MVKEQIEKEIRILEGEIAKADGKYNQTKMDYWNDDRKLKMRQKKAFETILPAADSVKPMGKIQAMEYTR